MTKMFPEGGGGSGGDHDVKWVTQMNNRALQRVPEGCAVSGILMDLQLLNPGQQDMNAIQLLNWAGDVPAAIYHRAGKLIARAQVMDRSYRTKIFDGDKSETHCVSAGEASGEMKTNTIFRPSVPEDDDQGNNFPLFLLHIYFLNMNLNLNLNKKRINLSLSTPPPPTLPLFF
jgi:hypothetical protein